MKYKITPLTKLEVMKVEGPTPLNAVRQVYCGAPVSVDERNPEEKAIDLKNGKLYDWRRTHDEYPNYRPLLFKVENLDNGKQWIVELSDGKVGFKGDAK